MTEYRPRGPAHAIVQMNPATAVPESLYADFARYLCREGFHVVTYNYRGMQADQPVRLGVDAGFTTWADYDVEAVTAWVHARGEGLSHLAVGHSFGGHAVGLCQSSLLLDGAAMVAAHAGCLRFIHPFGERLRARLMLTIIGPFCARTLGYVPGRKLGLGGDTPGQMMLEWSRWTRMPRYFFDDPSLRAAERFARVTCPVLSIGVNDDNWAPPEAVDIVAHHFTHSALERWQVGPEDSRGQAIGHMGFFRRKHEETLWPPLKDWLLARAREVAA